MPERNLGKLANGDVFRTVPNPFGPGFTFPLGTYTQKK